ncbi:MAG: Bax inhibitor-1/YccA family membrane protein [Bacilli bacterium]
MESRFEKYSIDSSIPSGLVEEKSVYKKVYLGIFITVIAYIVGLAFNFPALIASPLIGIVIWFGLIGMQTMMYRRLQNAQVSKNGKKIFIGYAIIEGLQLSYLVSLFSIIYLGESVIDSVFVNQVVGIAALITLMIAIITGKVARNMEVSEKNLKFMNALSKIIGISVGALFIVFIIGLITSLFGYTSIMGGFYNLYYGTGALGIGFSVIFTMFASFSLLKSFYRVNVATQSNLSSDYEYALATLVLTDIVWVFVEVLKLILKLLSKNRN